MPKTVFITGASTGIGQAAAQLFEREGWNVAATMRSPEKAGDWTQRERILTLRLDVTEIASIRDAMAQATAKFGQIDVVVNNAGYGLIGPFEASTTEQVDRQLATNVVGLMNVTREILPHFRQHRSGVLINISSMAGRATFPLHSMYHATKFAVEGFSEALVYELEPLGIRVKLVEPGAIKTDFYDRSQDVMSKPGLTAYDTFVAKVLANVKKASLNAPGPEWVARTIYKAATDGSNKLRYPVNSAAILWANWLLPTRWFQAIIRREMTK